MQPLRTLFSLWILLGCITFSQSALKASKKKELLPLNEGAIYRKGVFEACEWAKSKSFFKSVFKASKSVCREGFLIYGEASDSDQALTLLERASAPTLNIVGVVWKKGTKVFLCCKIAPEHRKIV